MNSVPPAPQAVPVVCAVIERQGHVLIAQRPPHKHLGLKWEFPGGKVEAGEEPKSALVRELREELGCRVEVTRMLPRFTHRYETIVIEMIPFVCTLVADDEPQPHEHVAVRWVQPGELSKIDLAAADWPVVTAYTTDL